MDTQNWIDILLEKNRLRQVFDEFVASGNSWTYVDRHVIDFGEELPVLSDSDPVNAVCVGGIHLLHAWLLESMEAHKFDIVSSKPLLFIDGEWIERIPNAPSPHVYIVMGRTKEDMRIPTFYDSGKNDLKSFPFKEEIRRLLPRSKVVRLEDEVGDVSAWIVKTDSVVLGD